MNSTNGLTLRLLIMNDRIMELATQATTYIDPSANDGVCWNFDKEKFVELIVAECMKLNSKELSITAIERLLPLYKEHFGVEV